MSQSGRMDSATEGFVAHRNLLFTVAYEMLGSAADADVVFLGDGGGVVQAALAPVVGAGPVASVLGRIGAAVSLQPAQVNGYPALILRLKGEIDTVVAVRIDNGLITGLYAVRNPEKLSRMERETAVSR
jgi:RNA polymerase sigma-70 factor, ECF subfamily